MKAAICKTLIVIVFLFQGYAVRAADFNGARSKIATVALAGIGGAILGLSTLSFYGQPSEHINNISTGFALGVIAGSAFVLADSAGLRTTNEVHYRIPDSEPPGFRLVKQRPPLLSYALQF